MRQVRYWLSLLLLCRSAAASTARAQLTYREHARQMDTGNFGVSADLNTFLENTMALAAAFFQPTLGRIGQDLRSRPASPPSICLLSREQRSRADHNRRLRSGNPWFAVSFLPIPRAVSPRLSSRYRPRTSSLRARDPRDFMALSRRAADRQIGTAILWLKHTLPPVFGASTRKERGMCAHRPDGDVVFGIPATGRQDGVRGADRRRRSRCSAGISLGQSPGLSAARTILLRSAATLLLVGTHQFYLRLRLRV